MSKVSQLEVRNAGFNTSGVERLLYIFETSTSFKTGKYKFTRPSLLIKDLSHPRINWYYPVELGLGLTHLNQSSVEVQIKPFQVEDFSSTHASMQSDSLSTTENKKIKQKYGRRMLAVRNRQHRAA